jgi:hypothetical protein
MICLFKTLIRCIIKSKNKGGGRYVIDPITIEKAFMLIEPGGILVTTNDNVRNNVMTISCTHVLDFTPQIALTTARGIIVSGLRHPENACSRSDDRSCGKVVGIATARAHRKTSFRSSA